MFAVNCVNRLIAAGSETRFPARKKHVTAPICKDRGRAGGAGAAASAAKTRRRGPGRTVPSWVQHLKPAFSLRPLSRGCSEDAGSLNGNQGRGGCSPRAWVFIQVGDLLVKSALRFQRPIPPKSLWGSTSSRFFRDPAEDGAGPGIGGVPVPRRARRAPRLPRTWLSRGCTSFRLPRSAAVVVVAMATGRGFIFNRGRRLERCLHRFRLSSASRG